MTQEIQTKKAWTNAVAKDDTAARIKQKQAQLRTVLEKAEKAGEKRPERWEALALLADQAGLDAQTVNAVALRALQNGGNQSAKITNTVGSILRRNGSLDAAKRVLLLSHQIAVDTRNDFAIYNSANSLGTLYFDLSVTSDGSIADAAGLGRAQAYFKESAAAAIRAEQKTAYPAIGLARCALLTGNTEEARHQLDIALKNDPRSELAHKMRARLDARGTAPSSTLTCRSASC